MKRDRFSAGDKRTARPEPGKGSDGLNYDSRPNAISIHSKELARAVSE
jgi:hypothetical protein